MAAAGDYVSLQITNEVFDEIPEDSSTAAIKAIIIIDHIHDDSGEVLAVGVTSHGGENAHTDVLKSQHQQFEGKGNWMVKLFDTEDWIEIEAVYETAIAYVGEVTGVEPVFHDGGFDKRKRKHHVYALVHRNVYYVENITDPTNLKNSVSAVKSSVRAYIRTNSSEFYIGITSGSDAIPAMIKRRTGDYYKDMHGINRMIAIFKSNDQQICQYVERELLEYYIRNPRNLNRIVEGGGRTTKQQWSYVYLAMHV